MGETIYGYLGKSFFQQGDTTRGCYRPYFNVLSVDLPGAAAGDHPGHSCARVRDGSESHRDLLYFLGTDAAGRLEYVFKGTDLVPSIQSKQLPTPEESLPAQTRLES